MIVRFHVCSAMTAASLPRGDVFAISPAKFVNYLLLRWRGEFSAKLRLKCFWGFTMKKFILLSFGFLGWAFYEMSGGADFEPASERMARLNPVADTAVIAEAEEPTETIVAAVADTFVDTDPPLASSVTRVSLNLTSLEDVLTQTDTANAVADLAGQDDIGVPVNAGYLTSSTDTPAIIPSLIAPNDGQTAELASLITSSDSGDVRTVSANRVNVRGGPGTDFGVVTKLARGDSVEILQDNGDGWVKMRTLNGGPEGWMADFLLVGG